MAPAPRLVLLPLSPFAPPMNIFPPSTHSPFPGGGCVDDGLPVRSVAHGSTPVGREVPMVSV